MSILKNTTINDTGYFQIPAGPVAQRPNLITTIIQWTNPGTQTYTVLSGNTPTLTNVTWTCPLGVTQIEVLVVAGGGGGSYDIGGGGGAGGLIYNSALSVTPGTQYSVSVGTGGLAGIYGTQAATNGNNSTFGSLTAVGGGKGGYGAAGSSGGSGGGGGVQGGYSGGTGTAGQGFSGGSGQSGVYTSGGGGGAGGPGGNGTTSCGGGGGPGLNFSISGTPTWYAGGGGASTYNLTNALPGNGGIGGGGNGGSNTGNPATYAGTSGAANTGGGGGGGGVNYNSGAGGSGIVIIRYSVTSTNTSPIGLMYYDSDTKQTEVYEGTALGWVPAVTNRNFGGHNLLTGSQNFTTNWNSYNAIVTNNATTAPDGSSTASKLSANSTSYAFINYASSQNLSVFSLYAKAADYSRIAISNRSTNTAAAIFDLTTGTTVNTWNGAGTIISTQSYYAGNGWWRIWVTMPASNQFNIAVVASNDSSASSLNGNNAVSLTVNYGVYIWGAQWESNTYNPGPYTYTSSAISPVPVNISGYRYHAYTSVGTSGFTPAVSGNVEILVVGGGGGSGGADHAGSNGTGAGGAGGLVYKSNFWVNANQSYTVIVGAGGAAGTASTFGGNGGNSQFGNIIAVGGGGGGTSITANTYNNGQAGGSGGGATTFSSIGTGGGAVPGQGNPGGTASNASPAYAGGGGGGAGSAGAAGTQNVGGNGGNGLFYSQFSNWGYPAGWFAGGGGGGSYQVSGTPGTGGYGGGGTGVITGVANAGVANTGGGAGGISGQGSAYNGAIGGSGIVIIRYRYD